ncbi:PKD domain-containing protein [Actinotalea sp. BY-33]|uniref:PKD domain-containing protein n=1 Tax=Actinotalea soli TaxID=2819234 RepID=A0A939LQL3_9CELL|nr:PKD domain-containing protein [Actinotalea soli]MBO1750289.1 PKD domain-containing protein [Actinotalea soli]
MNPSRQLGSAPADAPRRKLGHARRWSRLRRTTVLAIVLAMAVVGLPTVAQAQESTVSATASSLWQTNGIVRTVAYANGKIFAGGEFSTVRPPGASAGSHEVPRPFLAAFDAQSGALIASWNPAPNARVFSLAASPDGSRLYVGGDFTSIAGAGRGRIAAFDTSTLALQPNFAPYVSYRVTALAADADTVYLGGSFGLVAGQTRNRLAAVARSNGSLRAWDPNANWDVYDLDVSPSTSTVYLGGNFDTIGGTPSRAVAAVDTDLGAQRAFPARSAMPRVTSSCNSKVRDVLVDPSGVYFAAAGDGGGCFDGTFAAELDDGSLRWRNACLGATESLAMVKGSLYKGAHVHDCSSEGEFGESRPHRFLMVADPATGKNGPWWPNTNAAGSTQVGPLGMATDGTQLVVGGDFTLVNGQGQQGLARFAAGPDTPPRRPATPSARTVGVGKVKVVFPATLDNDDENLTYRLYRAGRSTPIWTTTMRSIWWQVPTASFVDTGLTPGTDVAYRVEATDGTTTVQSFWTNYLTVSATEPTYPELVEADGAASLWRFEDSSGPVLDAIGTNDATATSVVRGTDAGVLAGTYGGRFSSSSRVVAQQRMAGPQQFTAEGWVRTTSTLGGKILGFGSSATGSSSSYDRHMYLGTDGRVTAGVYSGATRTVRSTARVNDGQWHHVAMTFTPGRLELFVDGVSQGTTPAPSAESYQGYWRIGNDNLNGWPNAGAVNGLNGTIDEVAVYPHALSAADIAHHHRLGAGLPAPENVVPVASFTSSVDELTVSVDGSASSDPDGQVVSYAWSWGDGQSTPASSSSTATHTYAEPGEYVVRLTVTDDRGGTAQQSKDVVVTAPENVVPVASFTSSADELTVSVDGSASSDPDGQVVSYAWSWGDGQSTPASSSPTATHTYAQPGEYAVRLTVTDDDGVTGEVTEAVVVTGPPATTTLVEDTFERTVTNGLGSAETGGAWSVAGTVSRYGVGDGLGWLSMASPGNAPNAYLRAAEFDTASIVTTFQLDKPATGGGVYVSFVARSVPGAGDYRVKTRVIANGSVYVSISRVVGGAEAVLVSEQRVDGLSMTPGVAIPVRIDITGAGTTTIRAAVGPEALAASPQWVAETSDSLPALQVAGSFGLAAQLSGSATNAPVRASFTELLIGRAP